MTSPSLALVDRVGRLPPFERLHRRLAWHRLSRLRPEQIPRFEILKREFQERLDGLSGPEQGRFLNPIWSRLNQRLKAELLPLPAHSFLLSPLIQGAMAARLNPADLLDLHKNLAAALPAERLSNLLLEDAVGGPARPVLSWLSSDTQMHHLNDLVNFFRATGLSPAAPATVLEWGGGYGCMAKVFWRLRESTMTYVIVDSDVVSCLQWLYLSSVFGAGEVHQLLRDTDRIMPGRINLVPLGLLESLPDLRADVFLSTFALNESSPFAQDYAISRWFSAPRLLVSYALDVAGMAPHRVRDALIARGARIVTTPRRDSEYAWL